MAKPLSVLIVEDTESDAQLIVRMFKKAGYSLTFEQVETAAQMRAALEKQAWEIVISDFSMPELDGFAALKVLRETGRDIPFIVVSGTMGEDTAVAMMKAGAHDYVMKGNLARLVPAVKRELIQAKERLERKQVEAALRLRKQQHRTLLQTAMNGFWLLDMQGNLLEVNATYCRMSGYTEQELLSMHVSDLESEEAFSETASHIQKVLAQDEDRFESRHRRKDGSSFDVEISVQYRAEEGGRMVAFLQDITERKRAEELIRTSLQEKEVLLQEIHHRVKNNLQIISGLLTLQANQASGKPLDEIFRECQDRIHSIALIHEKLYCSRNLAEIAFDEYIRALTENLFTSHGVAAGRITVKYEMESVFFTIEKAIPLGLIANELVSNALKHAFPNERQGEIRIELHERREKSRLISADNMDKPRRASTYELAVENNGVILPAGFNADTQKTLGMHLVRMLAKQLQAELTIVLIPRTRFCIRFLGMIKIENEKS
jgi:two-component system response regulator